MSQNFQETYYGKKIDTSNILNIDDASKLLDGRKVVVITGVTGQDGSHMADYMKILNILILKDFILLILTLQMLTL